MNVANDNGSGELPALEEGLNEVLEGSIVDETEAEGSANHQAAPEEAATAPPQEDPEIANLRNGLKGLQQWGQSHMVAARQKFGEKWERGLFWLSHNGVIKALKAVVPTLGLIVGAAILTCVILAPLKGQAHAMIKVVLVVTLALVVYLGRILYQTRKMSPIDTDHLLGLMLATPEQLEELVQDPPEDLPMTKEELLEMNGFQTAGGVTAFGIILSCVAALFAYGVFLEFVVADVMASSHVDAVKVFEVKLIGFALISLILFPLGLGMEFLETGLESVGGVLKSVLGLLQKTTGDLQEREGGLLKSVLAAVNGPIGLIVAVCGIQLVWFWNPLIPLAIGGLLTFVFVYVMATPDKQDNEVFKKVNKGATMFFAALVAGLFGSFMIKQYTHSVDYMGPVDYIDWVRLQYFAFMKAGWVTHFGLTGVSLAAAYGVWKSMPHPADIKKQGLAGIKAKVEAEALDKDAEDALKKKLREAVQHEADHAKHTVQNMWKLIMFLIVLAGVGLYGLLNADKVGVFHSSASDPAIELNSLCEASSYDGHQVKTCVDHKAIQFCKVGDGRADLQSEECPFRCDHQKDGQPDKCNAFDVKSRRGKKVTEESSTEPEAPAEAEAPRPRKRSSGEAKAGPKESKVEGGKGEGPAAKDVVEPKAKAPVAPAPKPKAPPKEMRTVDDINRAIDDL